ncbi:MAG: hypothetical protein H6Q20_2044 [Bacteroidetes bacterium]|nr:hypothetical protein [Bacteroidota bacterium]
MDKNSSFCKKIQKSTEKQEPAYITFKCQALGNLCILMALSSFYSNLLCIFNQHIFELKILNIVFAMIVFLFFKHYLYKSFIIDNLIIRIK